MFNNSILTFSELAQTLHVKNSALKHCLTLVPAANEGHRLAILPWVILYVIIMACGEGESLLTAYNERKVNYVMFAGCNNCTKA